MMFRKKKDNKHYGSLISVFVTYTLAEAVMIRARLEDAGIPALIQQESASSALPLTVGPMGEIHITVEKEQVEAARQTLADLAESDAVEEEDDEIGSDEGLR